MNKKDTKLAIEDLFEYEGIRKSLWYTKYSYSKIYSETRYKFAFGFQILFIIMFLLSLNPLFRIVFFDGINMHDRLLLLLCIGAGFNSLSEICVGNLSLGVKWLGLTICFYIFL